MKISFLKIQTQLQRSNQYLKSQEYKVTYKNFFDLQNIHDIIFLINY